MPINKETVSLRFADNSSIVVDGNSIYIEYGRYQIAIFDEDGQVGLCIQDDKPSSKAIDLIIVETETGPRLCEL